MKKILYVDLDDVMAETLPAILREYNKMYNANAKVENIDDWQFYRCLGHDTKEGLEIIHKIFNIPGWWLGLKPISGAKEVMRMLNRVYNMYICTTPFESDNCIPEKIAWLRNHFPFLEQRQRIFIYDKNLLIGDYMIDDKPANLADFCGETILYRMPHNKHYHKFNHIVENWTEIEDLLL